MSAPVLNRYQAITVVPDTGGFVLGRPGTTDFVAVPEIGGLVMRWLQAGHTVAECEVKARAVTGEDVDVEEFLTDLAAAGLLADAPPTATPRGRRVGQVFFGIGGLAVLIALALTGVILLLADAGLRPDYRDGLPLTSPLGSIVFVAIVSMSLAGVHEIAHKLAAARIGVHGRISLGRRLYYIVAQTDLTGLWAVERRKRVVPLVAGMLVDSAIAGVVLLLQAVLIDELSPSAVSCLRAVVFILVGGLVAQTAVYMRTDLYALILVVTGCQNLWGTKGALARRIVRRPSADDLEILATASRREIIWAWLYLAWYVPGVLIATWYLVVFTLPVTVSLVTMSADSIGTGSSLSTAGGVVAMALAVVPLAVGVFGAGRSAVDVIRRGLRGERAGDPRSPRIPAS